MRFFAYGHENISALHKTTLEFTKDPGVTETGDCIVGIKADFEQEELQEFLKASRSIRLIIKINNLAEEIKAQVNHSFSDDKEMIIRKSDFGDKRTFAINADKAAADLSREFVKLLKKPEVKLEVILEVIKE